MRKILLVSILFSTLYLKAQNDTVDINKINFTGDFRFRIEHDWNSRNSNGELRNDRSRLRYRFRFGLAYQLDNYSSFGGRMRSGNLNDQQGPHVTIGDNTGEFSLISVGLEKLFYKFQNKKIAAWVGKNSFSVFKLNEVFWNDNVFPEGIAFTYFPSVIKNEDLFRLSIHLGHFIIKSNNATFKEDSYLQFIQFNFSILNERIKFFPGFYHFKNIANYPDGFGTFNLDYSIFHLGSQISINKDSDFKIGLELYKNFQDYSQNDSIPSSLRDQGLGFVISAQYGRNKEKGDVLFYLAYANIQKFSIVDYFAQNNNLFHQ